jgi:hypothetical protein
MSLLTKLYEELDRLLRSRLVEDVSFVICNAPHAQAPGSYKDLVSIRFPSSVQDQKISRIRDYIEQEYGRSGLPVEKVELRSSHIIHIHILKISPPT